MLPAILVLSFVVGTLATLALFLPARDTSLRRRLAEVQQLAVTGRQAGGRPVRALLEEEELSLPFGQRVLLPIWEATLKRTSALLPHVMQDRARQRLARAGVTMDPARFVGLQATAAAAGVLLSLLLVLPAVAAGEWAQPGLLAVIFGLVAWRLPVVWLGLLSARRRRGLEQSLPDVLDLLSVSVEAGLGFDGAVQKVAEKFPEPTAGEFREFMKEVRLGRPRADALRALAERSGVPDLQSFAAAIIQADQLGVSIARVLRTQADAMRQKRKQRAEEKAMQLPIKLLFPLIIFIFPTLFIVILGPIAMQLAQGLQG